MATTTEKQETGLAVIEPTNTLSLFKDGDGLQDLLTDIRTKATSLVPDITTAKGRKEIASVAAAVARTKTYLDGIGKTLVDELKEVPKKIDASRKIVRDELDKLKDEVRAPLTAWEDAEKARAEALQQRLDTIQHLGNAPSTTPGATAEQIESWLMQVQGTPIDDTWEDRKQEAEVAKEAAASKLATALAARQQYEQEQAELAALREKQAKQEQEERERRIAEEAAAAEAKRQETERLAAQQREADAKRRQEEAERRAQEAEAEARRTAELAEQRRKEAEANAQLQAEEAAARAAEQERQRIEAEQRAAADEQAKREADVEHRRGVNQRIVSDLIFAADLDYDQATAVAKAIILGQVTHVSVQY